MKKDKLFRRAYVGGTFDCLHRGHIALLLAVKGVAVETVVSLNTDEFAARYKRHPFMPLLDRALVLSHCQLVDTVMINEGDEDSKIAIASANVDCIVHGDDWEGESLIAQMDLTAEWLEANGITMVSVPYTKGVSTSALVEEYEHRKLGIARTIPDPDVTTCKECHRAVMVQHLNEDGNCGCVTPVGHDPVDAN